MNTYEDQIAIRADADRIVDFIGDVRNLPKYLPTTRQAQPQGPGRVRVLGEAHGHSYDDDGYLRCDRQARRLEWGSDEGHYRGSMQVEKVGEDEARVSVRIELDPSRRSVIGPSDGDIRDGMRKSLESIRNHLEGTGGKVEPAAATGGVQETTSGL